MGGFGNRMAGLRAGHPRSLGDHRDVSGCVREPIDHKAPRRGSDFPQFFEGTGLGGCIIQAKFKAKSMALMIVFFSLTTPVGVTIGMGISAVYNENSPTALIVEGILNAAAAGILIYMATVDLLAAGFMSNRVQGKARLQVALNVSLLLGAVLMSMLAKWA